MSLQDTKQAIKHQLTSLYEPLELNSIVNMLIEEVTGWDALHQNLHKNDPIDNTQSKKLATYTAELITGKPIQYILQKAWFMGQPYLVNEHVLIPRPETEELVEWIISYAEIVKKPLHILDIGTGSGCIPIALKLAIPNASISTMDVSSKAIEVAQQNAATHHTAITFIEQDILQSKQLQEKFDIIVSNPPYIPYRENETMQKQVTDFEPAMALFVSDHFPLQFYAKIAQLGKQALHKNGQLFFEIHYDQGKAILKLLDELGYHAELKQDMYGKDRMVRASLKN